jgi:tRNA dimethylallyltransferase
MLDAGWVDEVRQLLAAETSEHPSQVARQAVGYEEIIAYLEGRLSYEDMVDRIQARTRQFCKRQMTWFRHIEECVFFETSGGEGFEALFGRLIEFLQSDIS